MGHNTYIKQAGHSDPNKRQALAANPETSVWVSASAGTGKTKILTDRVLRLMLPRRDQPPESATPPDKILCLTFTKTGASEMADRIHERLSKWSVMPDDKLASVLEALLQYPPDADTMSAARALFAGVVDTPGGMKIMTLHSFCQSVLKRFPLEAGLPPHFEVLDERTANEYLQKALRDIVVEIRKHPDSSVADAFTRLSRTLNAEQFHELMQDIIKNRSAVRKLRNRYPDVENLQSALFKLAGLNRPITAEDYKSEYALPDGDFLALCREHIDPLLSSKGKNDTVLADLLTEFAAADEPSRLRMFDNYALGFLTQKGTIRASVVSKPVSTKFPAFADAAQKEAERLFDLHEKLKAIYLSQMTYDLMVVGFQMMDHYNRAKSAAVQLDYDDLIDYTEQLLDDPEQALWVLYKMDRGIDHILVDEAQDTSPSQWAVVRALAMDFFSGMGARSDTLRTLFVVGDEKQSIFSFQGADPAGFQTM